MLAGRRRWLGLGVDVSTNKQTAGERVRHTSRVCPAPEHDGPALVLFGSKDLVELQGEAVQMANVEGAEVVVESIVQKGIINRKVARR